MSLRATVSSAPLSTPCISEYGGRPWRDFLDPYVEWERIDWSEIMLRILATIDCKEPLTKRACRVGRQLAMIARPASIMLQ